MLRKTTVAGILSVFDKLIARLEKHAERQRRHRDKIALKVDAARRRHAELLNKLDEKASGHSIEAMNADAAIVRIKRSIFGEAPEISAENAKHAAAEAAEGLTIEVAPFDAFFSKKVVDGKISANQIRA